MKTKAEFHKITPAQAEAWLAKAATNRTLSPVRVSMYAEMMRRGEWYETNQGIAFNSQGQLIDGQHRLNAIIEYGKPVQILVTTGLADPAQLVLDQGLKRAPHDQIKLREGWHVTAAHSAVAKEMILSISERNEARNLVRDILLFDRYYVRHHKAIEFAITQFETKKIQGITVAIVMAPIARAWYTHNQDKLAEFASLLLSGRSIKESQLAAITLRNWLMENRRDPRVARRRSGDRRLVYKKTEQALDAFLKGSTSTRILSGVLNQELFPIPGEPKGQVIKLIKKQSPKRAGLASIKELTATKN